MACMIDVQSVFKDRIRQRRIQAATSMLAVVGFAMWMAGLPTGEYLAAAAIIFFAVATVRWINDEAVIERERLQMATAKK